MDRQWDSQECCNYMLHVQESVNLTIYLYAQTMGQPRMLYIRKFYVVKNIYIYILAVGVARSATPTPCWWGTSRPPQAPPRA